MANVAIIEDSELVIQMLTMVCQGEGHQVASYERFDKANQGLRDSRPDIIITDLNLPDVPGDIVAAIRGIDGLEETPVIIVSGRSREELEAVADRSGAQGALSKDEGMPVISAELPEMIDDLLG